MIFIPSTSEVNNIISNVVKPRLKYTCLASPDEINFIFNPNIRFCFII